ncbi:hypothetical protein UFOVP266_49 [uncultured Caudovirales phage]|uniref:DNA transfer protein n=1 Tax=uncultured Caudovirales phage TaxID=2100421 RepID=A0A6J5LJI9_9CAUD|nr:hypothetical protein UFOVP266_49 [uncultured Caudovirales phage]
MAFILGAVIGAGASLIGASMASSAAQKAADTQAASSDKAVALQREMYLKNLELNKPFREAGLTAQNQLLTYLGLNKDTSAPGYGAATGGFTPEKFTADPGYAFRLKEGLKGLNASAAAKGGMISGNALKAAMEYGQDLGSQEYQNAFNRYYKEREAMLTPLQSLTGTAQTTSSELGTAGQRYASTAGQNIENAGAARASGYTGAANAWNRGLEGAANAFTRGMTNNYWYGGGGGSPYTYGAGGYYGQGPFMGG